MQAFPSLSVVIPSYNQGQFIERTLLSILRQDYPGKVEVIVADGGSTDETVAILKKYDTQLTWWSAPDAGFVDAVTKGVARATGEILAIQSSDDYYLAGAFRSMAAAFRRHPTASFVSGGDYAITLEGVVVGASCPHGEITPRSILLHKLPSQHATFIKRHYFDLTGGLRAEVDMCADVDQWYRVANLEPGQYISEMLAVYQLQPNQRTATSNKWPASLIRMMELCEQEPRYNQAFRLTPAERRDLYTYWEVYWTAKRDKAAARPIAFAKLPGWLGYSPRTRRTILEASINPLVRKLAKKALPTRLARVLKPLETYPISQAELGWWQA
ncbi:glycosyltransferase [Hymenobacter sp. H14-R3]|uniref:glycosyltransferase n=1 Tax=Hymenobacter sp. H14-R3 TaxID=3046308 RepID=UPI0024BAB18C|nr:glycosyltransferase [Hymenobacter sp. H14-R3]MDJ0367079.1 glycosyltransferase [Hymenobacter sp. H14-R3]